MNEKHVGEEKVNGDLIKCFTGNPGKLHSSQSISKEESTTETEGKHEEWTEWSESYNWSRLAADSPITHYFIS
ncbi:hypothetical protein J6590_037207 [Homalodisca vitripennis]|nr:hypothetical protein J6590_037207 [Homalodisca vitripennis]